MGMGDFGNYTYPVANKPHKCVWCGEEILKGEKHTQFKGCWQGDMQNWRMHNECNEALAVEGDIISEGFPEGEGKRGKAEFN
jgi:predicted  nucleic acid-binding Zn-ribbon protein